MRNRLPFFVWKSRSYQRSRRVRAGADSNYWLMIVTNATLVTDKITICSASLQENKQDMTNGNI